MSQRMSSGRPVSRGSRPPPTAIRGSTALSPGGSSMGVLSAQIRVADRPVTQQGLSGIKTSTRGPQRQVLDKSYYLGLLRSKVSELSMESSKLQKDVDAFNQENSVYLNYEKRAELLAGEIKDLQGQLADYNTLVDKLNTHTEMEEVLSDIITLKAQNDREAQSIDVIFTRRREKEAQMEAVQSAVLQQKEAALNIIREMNPDDQNTHSLLKNRNEQLIQELETQQEELNALLRRKEMLEGDLLQSQGKQESVVLHEKLLELQNHREELKREEESTGSREKLLTQVKENNQEISSLETQLSELREKISVLNEELRQMDSEEQHGERTLKYKELQKKEQEIDVFLEAFEESKAQDLQLIRDTQSSITALLEHCSRNLSRLERISSVSSQELQIMQDDLNFKENEMQKSQSTARGLSSESERLQQDLLKVDQLEGKVTTELQTLREDLRKMREDLETYRDLEALRTAAEQRRKKLQEELLSLAQRKHMFKKMLQKLSDENELLRSQLQENEVHVELSNMERKWQHHEQNNHLMKEFIASRAAESDYQPLVKSVQKQLQEFNRILQGARV